MADNYLYNININQFALMEYNKEYNTNLDILDATIFIVFQKLTKFKNSKMDTSNEFYWFNYKLIQKQVPCFPISSKNGIINRFKKLVICNIFVPKILNNGADSNEYFKFTEQSKKLYTIYYSDQNLTTDQNLTAGDQNLTDHWSKNVHYNSNNKNIISNILLKKEKSISKDGNQTAAQKIDWLHKVSAQYFESNKSDIDLIKKNSGWNQSIKGKLKDMINHYAKNAKKLNQMCKDPIEFFNSNLPSWLSNAVRMNEERGIVQKKHDFKEDKTADLDNYQLNVFNRYLKACTLNDNWSSGTIIPLTKLNVLEMILKRGLISIGGENNISAKRTVKIIDQVHSEIATNKIESGEVYKIILERLKK